MVKAEVRKTDGTRIVIDGSEEEVKRLLNLVNGQSQTKDFRSKEKKKVRLEKMSIGDMILELKEEGFLDKPKSLIEIKNALEEKGRIYEVTTLSTQVIRQVRKRNIGRVKKDKKWMYVRR